MGRPAARRQAQAAQSDSPGPGRGSARANRKHQQAGIVGGRKRATRSSSNAVVTPESLQQEETGVATELQRLGLMVKDVKGDGNCLYRSCSDQLYGNDAHHAELRRQVCDYLSAHPDFAIFLDPDLNLRWEQYVALQRRSTEYGGYLELLAVARLYKRSIRVVMATNSYTVAWFDESDPSNASTSAQPYTPPSPPASVRTRSRSTTATTESDQTLVEPSLASQPGASMIWVALYESAEHYSSIRVQGRMDDAARVPDALCVAHNAAPHVPESTVVNTGSTSREGLLQRVLSALPPDSVSPTRAKSVLERVKGDWEQAVEILLEEDVVESTPETSPCLSVSTLPDERSVVSDLVPASMDVEQHTEDGLLRGSPPAVDFYRSLTPVSASTSPSRDSSAADSSGSSAAISRAGTRTPPPRKRPTMPRDDSMLERVRKPHPISPTDGTQALAADTAYMLDKIVIRTSPPSPSASASSHDSGSSKHHVKKGRKPRTRSGLSPSRDADGSKLPIKTTDTSMGAHRVTRSRGIAA